MTEAKVFAESLGEVKDWRQTGVCRCCLSRGYFQAMDTQYSWDGAKENYADMLRETFQITLQEVTTQDVGTRPLICGACVLRLRNANAFQRQVHNAERTLQNRALIQDVVEIKFEPKEEPFLEQKPVLENFNDDNYAQSDADEDQPLSKMPSARRKSEPKKRIKLEGATEKSSKKKSNSTKVKSENQVECPRCGKTFKSNDRMQRHVRNFHQKPPKKVLHACPMCSERFEQYPLKTKHLRDAHGITRGKKPSYKCKMCEKLLPTFQDRLEHVRQEHKLKAACPQCPQRFLNHYHKRRHLEEDHGFIGEQFPCGACDKVFKRRSKLLLHQRSAHMLERNFHCTKCTSSFFSAKLLKNHMVRHGAERIFECEFCKKRFPRRNTLMYHRRIHTGDKRSICKICNEAFVQSASLKYHMTRHHPEA